MIPWYHIIFNSLRSHRFSEKNGRAANNAVVRSASIYHVYGGASRHLEAPAVRKTAALGPRGSPAGGKFFTAFVFIYIHVK